MSKAEINKPVMVVRQEFIESLYKLINESGLPPVMIEPVLSGVLADTRSAMQRQYEAELKEYQNSVKEKEPCETA